MMIISHLVINDGSKTKYKRRHNIRCPEEIKPVPRARDPKGKEDRDEVRVVAAEVVLGKVRVDSAFVPIAVKKPPMNWEDPVMSKNVLNAERP
jgi:hypothetical protein